MVDILKNDLKKINLEGDQNINVRVFCFRSTSTKYIKFNAYGYRNNSYITKR